MQGGSGRRDKNAWLGKMNERIWERCRDREKRKDRKERNVKEEDRKEEGREEEWR